MELWIRSQDRNDLVKVNQVFIENDVIKCFDSSGVRLELGFYKEERALEILDEIQLTMWERNQVANWTYEMPKD